MDPVDGQPPSLVEQFLFNPAEVLKNSTLLTTSVEPFDYNMTTVQPAVFANRLTMLWNTWSKATKDNGLLTGFQFRKSNFTRFDDPSQSLMVNLVVEWSFQDGLIYHVDFVWYGLYMASVLVMLVCSIVSVIIKVRLKIPEVLGYVSSLTRDSRYCERPGTCAASTRNGKE
jgi:hypothetical protein